MDGKIHKLPQKLKILLGGEDLKVAETKKARRDPANHSPGLHLAIPVVEHVTQNLFPGQVDRQCPGCWDAEMMHGFAAEEFPDRRTQHRQTICPAGVGSRTGPFKLQGPTFSFLIDHIPKVYGPPVSQLPGPIPELMPPVTHRERLHPFQECIAGENLCEFTALTLFFGQTNEFRSFPGKCQHLRIFHRFRHHPRIARSPNLSAVILLQGIFRKFIQKRIFETQTRKGVG